MLQEFKDHISNHLPFLLKGRLLIACSGGLDSVVLTHLCNRLSFEFGIAHCNFKLRDIESDTDEKFVKTLAHKINAPFFCTSFETERYAGEEVLSIQMAARDLRYRWFDEIAIEYQWDYILTAHHADDNLETFLINLSRGTGIDGLTGIPEINNKYIRPLLPFSRDQMLEYAKKHEIEWREDSSNQSKKYVRNKLRHDVIPELKSVSPGFLERFGTTLSNLKAGSDFIKVQLFKIKKELFLPSEDGSIRISINKLHEYGNPRTSLFFLLKEYGFKAWDDIEQIMTSQSGKQIFSTSHRLVKDRDYLLLSPIVEKTPDIVYTIPEEESMFMFSSGTLKFKEVEEMYTPDLKTIFVDKKKLKYPLFVRKWKEGDYFYPLGMEGKKKLSKYFKDEKLSLLAKERVWLLCSENEIIWIINYRADNRFKITSQTEEILKITIT
ncbi:tRNA lysidine(34) synthetase TilS [Aquimarina sp. AU474]|uniref:tRNA lysidine(34) synthetase TilS n=1 Tax=Aquimarina sp. AU474 TaxID=2108529 RepID=UPI000D687682|nr:tRNA lysidine(34) synthetase TilS [Aquimarina sp. AU474]